MSMFSRRDKAQLPTADEALPGRPEPPVRGARASLRARHAARAAVPGGVRAGGVRDGLLLGRGAQVLGGATACTRPRSVTPVASRRTRRTKRCAAVAPVTPRSCSSCSIRRRRRYDDDAARLLGEPRPDAGHAPGQRRRHAVPLGDLHVRRRAGSRRPRRRARCSRRSSHDAGYGEITTEIVDAPTFYYAEDYHQQYLAKNPGGYCGLGGTGVSCPIGLARAD